MILLPSPETTRKLLLISCHFWLTQSTALLAQDVQAELDRQAVETVPRLIAPATAPKPKLADPSLVQSEKTVNRRGHSFIYQKLAPPPTSLTAEASPTPTPSSVSNSARKPRTLLQLSTTVYNRTFAEVRWNEGELKCRALVKMDFSLLRGLGRIETSDRDYSLVLGIGEVDTFNSRFWRKGASEHETKLAAYLAPSLWVDAQGLSTGLILLEGDASKLVASETFQALPALLAYYQTNEEQLRWGQALQKAENAARQRWQEANPTKPATSTTIQFWPSKSRRHLGTAPAQPADSPAPAPETKSK